MSDGDCARVPRFGPDQWLWCLHCKRFFQARDLRPDRWFGTEGCAFEDCGAAGLHIDLFEWDAWAPEAPALRARWPAERDLYKGLAVTPLDGDEDFDALDVALDLEAFFSAPERDPRRRDLILGIVSRDNPDEDTAFENLDLGRLALLVQEGHLLPDARHRHAPTPRECFGFMRRWPQVRAHGHAVHPRRDDYGVVIDSLGCVLEDVPAPERDALRTAFREEYGDADGLLDDGVTLFAWWD